MEKIILYNGSLEELNSINPKEQYKIKGLEFHFLICEEYGSDVITKIKERISQEGYAGLVNERISIACRHTNPFTYLVEGTPIVKAD